MSISKIGNEFVKIVEDLYSKNVDFEMVDELVYESLKKNVCFLITMLKKDFFDMSDEKISEYLNYLFDSTENRNE